MIDVILNILATYLILGLIFSVAFISRGCQRIDSDAKDAGFGFRLLIIPATVALWPLLLNKWLAAFKLSRSKS